MFGPNCLVIHACSRLLSVCKINVNLPLWRKWTYRIIELLSGPLKGFEIVIARQLLKIPFGEETEFRESPSRSRVELSQSATKNVCRRRFKSRLLVARSNGISPWGILHFRMKATTHFPLLRKKRHGSGPIISRQVAAMSGDGFFLLSFD